MATFVLVAGAWHGGWCWKRVTPLLLHAGHEVYTPTLTGLGERVHLASPEINFETHVTDIVNVLKYEDLTDVTLVGHSYGGVVTGTVAHRVPERIGQLIYLDAMLPEDGKTIDQIYEDHGQHDVVRRFWEVSNRDGEGWYLPPPAPNAPSLRVTDPENMAWIAEKLTLHPMGSFKTIIRLGNPAAQALPRTYIACLPHPPSGLIPIFTKQVQADPSWNYRELEASHDPMITDPEALTKLLLDIIS